MIEDKCSFVPRMVVRECQSISKQRRMDFLESYLVVCLVNNSNICVEYGYENAIDVVKERRAISSLT